MKLMFDKEMFNRNYKSFKDVNNRTPYIICNSETMKMLPQIDTSDCHVLHINTVDICKSIYQSDCELNNMKTYIMWNGIKVFLDDGLAVGEVIFA